MALIDISKIKSGNPIVKSSQDKSTFAFIESTNGMTLTELCQDRLENVHPFLTELANWSVERVKTFLRENDLYEPLTSIGCSENIIIMKLLSYAMPTFEGWGLGTRAFDAEVFVDEIKDFFCFDGDLDFWYFVQTTFEIEEEYIEDDDEYEEYRESLYDDYTKEEVFDKLCERMDEKGGFASKFETEVCCEVRDKANELLSKYINKERGLYAVKLASDDGDATFVDISHQIPMEEWSDISQQYVLSVHCVLILLKYAVLNSLSSTDMFSKIVEDFYNNRDIPHKFGGSYRRLNDFNKEYVLSFLLSLRSSVTEEALDRWYEYGGLYHDKLFFTRDASSSTRRGIDRLLELAVDEHDKNTEFVGMDYYGSMEVRVPKAGDMNVSIGDFKFGDDFVKENEVKLFKDDTVELMSFIKAVFDDLGLSQRAFPVESESRRGRLLVNPECPIIGEMQMFALFSIDDGVENVSKSNDESYYTYESTVNILTELVL